MNSFLAKLYLISVSLVCFSIPISDFGEAIPNILLGLSGFLIFTVIKREDLKKIKTLPVYLFASIILLFACQTILLERWEDVKFVVRLLIVPALGLLFLPIKNQRIPVFAFLSGAFIMVLYSLQNLYFIYLSGGEIDFATGDFVNQQILGERPYLGFVCVISVCLCLYLADHYNKKNRKLSALFYFLILYFISFIVIISARISVISIIIILGSYFIFYLKNTRLKLIFVCIGVVVFSGIFIGNKDLKKRFFITENSYTIEQMMKFEPRYYIWNCSLPLIKESPILGWGIVVGQDKLKECFLESGEFLDKEQQDYFVRSRFNTHNQFLSFLLSEGVICFLLFISFFASTLARSKNNFFSIILLISLLLFCLVENVLSRQMGCMLFGFVWVISRYFTLEVNEPTKIKHDEASSNSRN